MMNTQKKFLTTIVALALGTVATGSANAAIDVKVNNDVFTALTEDKAISAGQHQANDEVRFSVIRDVLLNWNKYSEADRQKALNDLKILNNGDTFTMYPNHASTTKSQVSDAPIIRIGAGSVAPTKKNAKGETVVDLEDVASGTFGEVTQNFAGGETSGAVVIGNKNTGDYRTITQVAAGRITPTSTDAINGSQLYGAMAGINLNAKNIKKGFNISNGTTTDNVQLGDTITHGNTDKNIVIKVGDNKIDYDLAPTLNVTTGVNVGGANGVKITGTGIDSGNHKIVNVSDGDINPNSKDAINGSQLHATNEKIAKGLNVAADKGTPHKYALGDTVHVNGGTNTNTLIDGDKVKVNLNNNIHLDKGMIDGLRNGAVSPTSTEAINGSQLHETNQNVTNLSNTVAQGFNFSDGKNTDNVKLGQTVKLNGDNNTNIVVSDNNLSFSLKDNLNIKGNVTSGTGFHTGDVHITPNGANMGGTQIKNLKAGTDGSDAVTVDQLKSAKLSWTISDKKNNDVVSSGETLTYTGSNTGNIQTTVSNNTVTFDIGNKLTVNDSVNIANTTVSMGKDGINAGDKKVTHVAAGTVDPTSTDAVNGSQLHATNQNVAQNTDKINKGFNVTTDKGNHHFNLGDTVGIKGDAKNISTTMDDKGNAIVSLNNNISLNQGKITGLRDGDISANSTDAVNGSQLYNVIQRSHTGTIGFVADNQKTANVSIGNTLRINGDKNIKTVADEHALGLQLNDDISVNHSVGIANTTISMSKDGINAGDKKITHVAAGTNATDAVNLSQLKPIEDKVNSGITIVGNSGSNKMHLNSSYDIKGKDGNVMTTANKDGGLDLTLNSTVTLQDKVAFHNSNVSVGKDGVNAGDKKVTYVAAGTISANSTDAVNGSQLYATNQNVAKGIKVAADNGTTHQYALGDTITVNGGKNISTVMDGDKVKVNMNNNVTLDKGMIDGLRDGNVSANSTDAINGSQLYKTNQNVTNNTNTINKGFNVTTDKGNHHFSLGDTVGVKGDAKNISTTMDDKGNAIVSLNNNLTLKGGMIDGVRDGKIEANSTEVVNGGQIYHLKTEMANQSNRKFGFTGNDNKTVQMGLGDVSNIVGVDGNIQTEMTTNDNGKGTIGFKLGDDLKVKNSVSIANTNVSMSKDGINAGDKKVSHVAAGTISANSTDAVNGSQLHETNQNVQKLDNKVNKGWNLADGKGNKANVQMGDTVTLKNTDGNVNIKVHDNGTTTVDLNSDLSVRQVNADQIIMNKGGQGINMNNTTISNLQDGKLPQDAVNVRQLNHAVTTLDNKINKNHKEAKAGTASAIATASLGQAWDYGSTSISAGVGHYDGQTAIAIGASSITDNGRWMLKGTASINQSKKIGVGASVTHQF